MGRRQLRSGQPRPTRPDLDGPPIAHLAAAREFGESVRHVPVYPGWAWRKPYLWGSLVRGQQTAQNATDLQRRVAAERGYDI